MDGSLGTIAFLANSENRVRILCALADKAQSRGELTEETGIARATLGRILADCQERGWVQKNGTQYQATHEVVHLIEEFNSLLATIEALDELGDLVQWFPLEDVSFDLGRLRDARVTRPHQQDALRAMTRSLSVMDAAEHIQLYGVQHAPPALEGLWKRVVQEERQTLEFAFTDELIATMLATEPDATYLKDLVASERTDPYRTLITRTYNIAVCDGTVGFALSDDHGAPQAFVESDDELVQEWSASFFEAAIADATQLTFNELLD